MKKLEHMIFNEDMRRHILGDGLQDYLQEGKNGRNFLFSCDLTTGWLLQPIAYETSWLALKETETGLPWDVLKRANSNRFMSSLINITDDMPLVSLTR